MLPLEYLGTLHVMAENRSCSCSISRRRLGCASRRHLPRPMMPSDCSPSFQGKVSLHVIELCSGDLYVAAEVHLDTVPVDHGSATNMNVEN